MNAWNSTLPSRRERPRRKAPQTPLVGEGAAILHPGPFRSQTLRDLAAKVPHCMYSGCKAVNKGQVVLAHSNRLQDGKGMGLKAHDVPCFVCGDCHHLIDEKGCEDIRLDATYNSVAWCLNNGHLKVAA